MPVSLRRGGVSASGSIGEIFPNSYGTRSAEIRGASGLSLSSLASTFCIGTGTLIDGETVYTVQGLEHIQALSARLLQADVDTKTLAPLVADPVTYAEIAVHSMTPLVSSQEYSSIVAAIRNIGDNHTAARVALALHLCPELATIAIQGYSTLTELIQTAHSRPDNFMT